MVEHTKLFLEEGKAEKKYKLLPCLKMPNLPNSFRLSYSTSSSIFK